MNLINFKSDIYDFYDFANRFIVPLMKSHQGLSDEEIHIGISRFHSSYMPLVRKAVEKYNVDEKKLIKWVSEVNCVNPTQNLFNEIAEKLKENG
jgi:hypothetical protein